METKNKLDLSKFNFPKISGVDMVFSTLDTNKELLAEARERGFYHGRTKYNTLFSDIFFVGGKVKFKPGIDEEFKKSAWDYCRAFMSSFSPKHEEKEAISAMIMSELLEPELEK